MDDRARLKEILKGFRLISEESSLPVIFPIHPRTRKRIEEFGLDLHGVKAIDPVGFLEFLQLEAGARLALTDSGGVQEETCILRIPCVTLRDNTERPETIEVGSNILAGADAMTILEKTNFIIGAENGWMNPFGDGRAGEYIINIIN